MDVPADEPGEAANGLDWAHDFRRAVLCAGTLLVFLLLLDRCCGRSTLWRCALWLVLAGLLFVVLCPTRVSAGAGWLASQRLTRRHRVRTDLLVSVRIVDGTSQRFRFRDALGGCVEVDPDVLVRNPQLWFWVSEGARKASADGLLLCGRTAIRLLSERVEGETAQTLLRGSGLE